MEEITASFSKEFVEKLRADAGMGSNEDVLRDALRLYREILDKRKDGYMAVYQRVIDCTDEGIKARGGIP